MIAQKRPKFSLLLNIAYLQKCCSLPVKSEKKKEQYYILFFNLIFLKNAFLSNSMESNKEILVS